MPGMMVSTILPRALSRASRGQSKRSGVVTDALGGSLDRAVGQRPVARHIWAPSRPDRARRSETAPHKFRKIQALRGRAAHANAQRAEERQAEPREHGRFDLEFISHHLSGFIGMVQKPASASSFVLHFLSNVRPMFLNWNGRCLRPSPERWSADRCASPTARSPVQHRRPQAGQSDRTVAWQVVRLRLR